MSRKLIFLFVSFIHGKFHSRRQFVKGNEHVMYVSDGIIIYDKDIVNVSEMY